MFFDLLNVTQIAFSLEFDEGMKKVHVNVLTKGTVKNNRANQKIIIMIYFEGY